MISITSPFLKNKVEYKKCKKTDTVPIIHYVQRQFLRLKYSNRHGARTTRPERVVLSVEGAGGGEVSLWVGVLISVCRSDGGELGMLIGTFEWLTSFLMNLPFLQ